MRFKTTQVDDMYVLQTLQFSLINEKTGCVGGGLCNCDTLTPFGYYSDSGHITDKDTLPVTGLEFKYRETFGSAGYTVGNLECFGYGKLSSL